MVLHDLVFVQFLRYFGSLLIEWYLKIEGPMALFDDECIYVPLPIIPLPIHYRFRAFQPTLSLLSFGTVALPAFTLYPGVRSTLPISM